MIYTDRRFVVTDGFDLQELHNFAIRLGIKKDNFKRENSRCLYELPSARYANRALKLGAIYVPPKQLLKLARI